MNKILVFLLFVISINARAQAHLGVNESTIKSMFPDNTWETGITKSGKRWISSAMSYGNFVYYFDTKTQLCDFCWQFPFNSATLNGQVEAYNKKYVITSDTSWTAYVDDGGIIYINLIYDKDSKTSLFTYSDTK